MNPFTIIESFKLHDGQLENWKKLSKDIDTDIAKAEGFISRDSGIDADSRVYCIVKWESKAHQEAFMKRLMAGEGADEMMKHFGSIANMETEIRNEVEIFG
jgi:heme-degrading monooxygenase HmoA